MFLDLVSAHPWMVGVALSLISRFFLGIPWKPNLIRSCSIIVIHSRKKSRFSIIWFVLQVVSSSTFRLLLGIPWKPNYMHRIMCHNRNPFLVKLQALNILVVVNRFCICERWVIKPVSWSTFRFLLGLPQKPNHKRQIMFHNRYRFSAETKIFNFLADISKFCIGASMDDWNSCKWYIQYPFLDYLRTKPQEIMFHNRDPFSEKIQVFEHLVGVTSSFQ